MKKLLLSAIAAGLLMSACHQSATTAKIIDSSVPQPAAGVSASQGAVAPAPAVMPNAPAMKFEYETHDFGKIQQGGTITYKFNFANVGKSPLIISDAHASCGCTIPVWPKDPIKPGDGGQIVVTFNSAGKMGLQDKMITIIANTTPPENMLHLVGEVTEKK